MINLLLLYNVHFFKVFYGTNYKLSNNYFNFISDFHKFCTFFNDNWWDNCVFIVAIYFLRRVFLKNALNFNTNIKILNSKISIKTSIITGFQGGFYNQSSKLQEAKRFLDSAKLLQKKT